MAQTKTFTAKQTLKLDCGHTINVGDTFVATTVYTCAQETPWPLKILMACFSVIQQKREQSTKQASNVEQTQAPNK